MYKRAQQTDNKINLELFLGTTSENAIYAVAKIVAQNIFGEVFQNTKIQIIQVPALCNDNCGELSYSSDYDGVPYESHLTFCTTVLGKITTPEGIEEEMQKASWDIQRKDKQAIPKQLLEEILDALPEEQFQTLR